MKQKWLEIKNKVASFSVISAKVGKSFDQYVFKLWNPKPSDAYSIE